MPWSQNNQCLHIIGTQFSLSRRTREILQIMNYRQERALLLIDLSVVEIADFWMLIVTAKLSLQTTSCSAISACNNKVQSLELNSPANTAASRLKAKSQKKKNHGMRIPKSTYRRRSNWSKSTSSRRTLPLTWLKAQWKTRVSFPFTVWIRSEILSEKESLA